MVRATLVGWLSLASLWGLQLAACRGILGIEEDKLPVTDGAAPACARAGLQCVGEDVLRMCAGEGLDQPPVDEPCAWGCIDGGAPHCAALVPGGGAVLLDDLRPDPALAPVAIDGSVDVNTDDGSIAELRPAGEGISNGIGFTKRSGAGVFTFGALAVNGALRVIGSAPAAFASRGDITVNGMIDVRGTCAGTAGGPGGWSGGPGGAATTGGTAATGIGGGGAGGTGVNASAGGGGGGDGAMGGKGASGTGMAQGGAGGLRGGDAAISLLHGGWGGGGGGATNSGTGGAGGGGGGAIQLVSNGTIAFGGGGGGINAGGCGGKTGVGGAGGGGGGAGGAILIEAPVVRLADTARLAANGGGGGGGHDGTDGMAGLTGAAAASGGTGGSNGGTGGAGGVTGALAGQDGTSSTHSGGGGGGTGRIRFNTRRGDVDARPGAVISPALGEPDTTATRAIAPTR